MYVNNQDTLIDQAVLEIATGGPYNGVKMALYTSDVFPTRGRPIEDFDFADFGGLTNQKAVTWSAPFLNAAQQAEVLGALLQWLTTTAPDPAVIAYGWILLNGAASAWIVAERFAEPMTFNAAGQLLAIVPRLVWDT